MTWTFTDDVDAFLDTAGAPPATRPSENTPVLTATASRRHIGRRPLISRGPAR